MGLDRIDNEQYKDFGTKKIIFSSSGYASFSQSGKTNGNKIIGDFNFDNSQVVFEGENNVLYAPAGAKILLRNAIIEFRGNNSLVFLAGNQGFTSSDNFPYSTNIIVYENNYCYFGKDSTIATTKVVCAEQGNLFIGNDTMTAYGSEFMLSDMHMIHNTENGNRINFSKPTFIGDHVWIAEYAHILKGTIIGSGSILGAHSIISGKTCPSNTIWAGNPATQVKKDAYFLRDCCLSYSAQQTKETAIHKSKGYVYNAVSLSGVDAFSTLDKAILEIKTAEERGEYLEEFTVQELNKDRFCIAQP